MRIDRIDRWTPEFVTHLLFAMACFAVVVTAASLLPLSVAASAALIGLLLVAILCWVIRSRRPELPVFATGVLVVVALAITFIGDGPTAMTILVVALLAVVLDISFSAGVAVIVTVLVLQSALMAFVGSRTDIDAFFSVVGTGCFLAFGLAYAVLVRQSERSRQARQALVEQLRESIEKEKDLVLADERARAARELHDGLGHRLTVAGMSLDFALRMRGRDDEGAWREVATARDTTSEALRQMRLWVRALHPVSVAGRDGLAGLDAIADAFRGTGLDVELTASGDLATLPKDVSLVCYRIVQEGLTNALRHGNATRVRLDLAYADRLTVTVNDDGAGCSGEPREGFGLRSLRERVTSLGGDFRAQSSTTGFALFASLPVTPGSAPRHAVGAVA